MQSALDLINKYSSVELEITRETEGTIENGQYVPGDEVTFNIQLPAFYLSEKDVEYYEGLNYTTQDLKIYTHNYLSVDSEEKEDGEPKDVFEGLKIDDEINFDGQTFVVDTIRNRSNMSDFFIVVAKRQTNTEGDSDD